MTAFDTSAFDTDSFYVISTGYPEFGRNPSQSSTEELLDDVMISRASNGSARGRVLYTEPKRRFSIVHEGLNNDDKSLLIEFYRANRSTPIDFLWVADGVTYTCVFAAPPKLEIYGYAHWIATSTLEEV